MRAGVFSLRGAQRNAKAIWDESGSYSGPRLRKIHHATSSADLLGERFDGRDGPADQRLDCGGAGSVSTGGEVGGPGSVPGRGEVGRRTRRRSRRTRKSPRRTSPNRSSFARPTRSGRKSCHARSTWSRGSRRPSRPSRASTPWATSGGYSSAPAVMRGCSLPSTSSTPGRDGRASGSRSWSGPSIGRSIPAMPSRGSRSCATAAAHISATSLTTALRRPGCASASTRCRSSSNTRRPKPPSRHRPGPMRSRESRRRDRSPRASSRSSPTRRTAKATGADPDGPDAEKAADSDPPAKSTTGGN